MSEVPPPVGGAAGFNELPESKLRQLLMTCLDVPRWVDDLLTGRPYVDHTAILTRARQACVALTGQEVAQALSGHPRIGERPGARHNAAASRSEQQRLASADVDVLTAIRSGNLAYERRFDRIFLIRAAGRSAEQVLAELTRRLGNSSEQEGREVAEQLTEITLVRLEGLLMRWT